MPIDYSDRAQVLKAVRRGGTTQLRNASDFQNDREMVLAAVSKAGFALESPSELKRPGGP